jgi:hypothetical protein
LEIQMPVTADKAAPYTSPTTVLEIIERHRSRGLPSPLNIEVLQRAGIPESLIARTLQSLQCLDLIDEAGHLTPTFEGLRKAPEADYKTRLAEWLNTAYADVLQFVDPANDDEVKVRDAFRSYTPVGQQPRMVTLFMGLYAAAGVASQKTSTPRQSSTPARPRPVAKLVIRPQVKAKDQVRNSTDGMGLPAALEGLLKSLPAEGEGWTQVQRNKFVATFGAVVDFCFPIVEPPALAAADDNEEEDRE